MKCRIIDCSSKAKIAIHRLCGKHYARYNKYGDPLFVKKPPMKKNCIECGEITIARDMCKSHYDKWHKKQTGLRK